MRVSPVRVPFHARTAPSYCKLDISSPSMLVLALILLTLFAIPLVFSVFVSTSYALAPAATLFVKSCIVVPNKVFVVCRTRAALRSALMETGV